MRASAVVDLAAVRANTRRVDELTGSAAVMAVVKADGYGHGMVPCARAALEGGATWLGTAFVEEALALRAAGLHAPALAWLTTRDDDLAAPVEQDVDLGVPSLEVLARVVEAARTTGRTARVHLKADTGLSRSGAQPADWPDLVEAAAKAQADGSVAVVGVWSHVAFGELGPDHPVNRRQQQRFDEALAVAAAAGLDPEVRHLANSGLALTSPSARYDLVRAGISLYGLDPTGSVEGLRPAMTLRAQLAVVKQVPAGEGTGYLHRHVLDRPTRLGLVPLGYGDGVPRAATNLAEVLVGGRRSRVLGTVSMDQFVVEVGEDVEEGDEVLLFGPGDAGEPTATQWADAIGTIDYEIVTRIGARVPRVHL